MALDKTAVLLDIGFSEVPPSTISVYDAQLDFDAMPKGVQIAAFVCSQGIEPVDIESNKIIGVMDVAKSTPVGTDVVFRVEQDQELAAALGEDLKGRLKRQGYNAHLWLLHKTTHKYTYAYIRALERQHE
jgi:hypothetical protein